MCFPLSGGSCANSSFVLVVVSFGCSGRGVVDGWGFALVAQQCCSVSHTRETTTLKTDFYIKRFLCVTFLLNHVSGLRNCDFWF